MSDFVSEFWNMYVVVLVLVGILACLWLLWSQSRSTFTQGKTMGHVWDETLEEYNNALPKWWSWLFLLTIVFSMVYLVLFPGLGKFQGVLGWTSAKEHKDEVDAMDKVVKPLYDRFMKMDVPAVAADKQANEMGKRLFLTYCMQCHAADGKGSKGFPNLTDNDWLYGGEPDQIVESIANGRFGVMPAHVQLGPEKIKDLAHYVRSLSGLPSDAARVTRGKEDFMTVGCSGCHGEDGKGMQAVGAPNLTDKIWLFSSSEAAIIEQISGGRQNQMPPWKDFIGDAKVHLLAGYVYSLGGGIKPSPKPAPAPEPAPAAVLGDVAGAKLFFEVGKADIDAEGKAALQAVIDYAKAHETSRLAISGFHDASGNQASNEELAKERAKAVRDALKAAGIAEDRIEMKKPEMTTGGADPREARRVEVSVI